MLTGSKSQYLNMNRISTKMMTKEKKSHGFGEEMIYEKRISLNRAVRARVPCL